MKKIILFCVAAGITFVGCVKSKTHDTNLKEDVPAPQGASVSSSATRDQALELMSVSLPSIAVKGETLLGVEARVGLKDVDGTLQNLGKRLPALEPGDGLVTYPVDYPAYQGDVDKRHTSSSFVIDFEGPQFSSHIAAVQKMAGDQVLMDHLISYVSKSIAPSYDHGMLLASDVAQKREGDCTELAFFLAALARHFAIPTQVVLGLVLVQENRKIVAFGHAWVEYYHDGWHLADAALVGVELATRYLPATVLQNEGPSYGLMLMSHMQGSLANEILLN